MLNEIKTCMEEGSMMVLAGTCAIGAGAIRMGLGYLTIGIGAVEAIGGPVYIVGKEATKKIKGIRKKSLKEKKSERVTIREADIIYCDFTK